MSSGTPARVFPIRALGWAVGERSVYTRTRAQQTPLKESRDAPALKPVEMEYSFNRPLRDPVNPRPI
jgi:hypothetical protein